MRNVTRSLFVSLFMLVPLQTWAAEKPPELSHMIQAPTPQGAAQLHKLFIHVYDASFWSDSGGWRKAPYALSITYAMDFSAEELAERTLSEMQHVSTAPEATLRGYTARLAKLWPNIKDGDRITALARADGSTLFFYNGKQLGAISDAQFAPAFFGIWLSPKSSEPAMRKQLLNESGA